MENLLKQFYDLCDYQWDHALIIHNLYQEALERTGGIGNYISTIDTDKLCHDYHCDPDNIQQIFFALEDKLGLSSFEPVAYRNDVIIGHRPTSSHYLRLHKVRWVRTYKYTLNCKEIETKLFFHSPAFYAQEREKVRYHNRRATELAHLGTLTFKQWMRILHLYDNVCAYCGGKYDVLEHFIPLTFPDSGTTQFNCVPSCIRCNSMKGPYHPERMPNKIRQQMSDGIKTVRLYIDWLKNNSEIEEYDYP